MGGDRDELLPLLAVLTERRPSTRPDGRRAPVTLSLTPVLCDQLEAPGAVDRCVRFLREIRPESHRLDIEAFAAAGDRAGRGRARALGRPLRRGGRPARAAGRGRAARRPRTARDVDVVGDPRSAAAAMPSTTAIELQLQTGIESHRRRFGEWGGGLWLPECAYAPWLAGAARGRGGAGVVRRADGTVRPRRPAPPATAADR